MSLRHSTREHHAPTELYEPDAGSVKHRSGGGAHKRKASVPKVAKKKTGTALKTTSKKSSKTKTTTSSSSSKAKKKQRREPSITPSPSRARSASPKHKASSSKAKTKGTKRAASSTKSKTASSKSKAGSSKKPSAKKKKRRTAVHNPRIAAIPNDATSADSEHNTPQHNPKTEAKRMSHYTPSELHQAQHIEESYEAKGMGEKKAKAIAFATVNKLRAQHGETMTSSE